jgi:flagellar biogenesis protein FliO
MATMLNALHASLAVLLTASSAALSQDSSIRTNGPISIEPIVTVERPDAPRPDDEPLILLDSPLPAAEMGPEHAPSTPVQPVIDPPVSATTDLPFESAVEPQPDTKTPDESIRTAAETGDQESIPLPAIERTPLGQGSLSASDEADAAPKSSVQGIMRTGGALAVVLGLILILRFIIVKFSGATGGLRAQLGAAGKAPSGVLFVLGRYPVSRGMSLVLLQLDQRVLLLSQTSAGFHTLAELSDPEEVTSIIRKAKDENGESLGAKFGSMLKQFERDPQTIDDLEPAAEAAPVRLRRPVESETDTPDPGYARYSGYYEDKPHALPRTGEDELRSRINRMREYGS